MKIQFQYIHIKHCTNENHTSSCDSCAKTTFWLISINHKVAFEKNQLPISSPRVSKQVKSSNQVHIPNKFNLCMNSTIYIYHWAKIQARSASKFVNKQQTNSWGKHGSLKTYRPQPAFNRRTVIKTRREDPHEAMAYPSKCQEYIFFLNTPQNKQYIEQFSRGASFKRKETKLVPKQNLVAYIECSAYIYSSVAQPFAGVHHWYVGLQLNYNTLYINNHTLLNDSVHPITL